LVIRLHNLRALFFGHIHLRSVFQDAGAKFHDLFRCSLDARDAPATVYFVWKLMDSAHSFSSGIKRKFTQPRCCVGLCFHVDPGFLSSDAKARFGRIAQNRVAVVLLIRRKNARITAKRRRRKQHFQIRIFRRGDLFFPQEDLPFGGITESGHIEFLPWQPGVGNGHFILSQRAGLIGTNHRGASERFYRGKSFHKRMFLRHALHSHGKCQRNGREQTFRNECDDHAECENECLGNRLLYKDGCGHKKCHADADGNHRNLFCQNIKFLLQRAFFFFRRLRQFGNAAEFGLHADARDQGPRGSACDARSRKDQVWNLKAGHIVLQKWIL